MYIWGMRRYITILLFTFIFLGIFPSLCIADVVIKSPRNGATVSSEIVNFQWENTDTANEYTYTVDLGPATSSTEQWYPKVGISVSQGTSYSYTIPESWGNNIMWWVRYHINDSTLATNDFSTYAYSFNIAQRNSTITEVIIEESKPLSLINPTTSTNAVVRKPAIITSAVGGTITEGMVWNVNTNSVSKPFSFPLKELAGVTQWHGYTAFQKPHTGIDFGVTQKEVVAISDGEVVTKGWDNFNGECLSGGNYLVIRQSNGMHAAYFHLQDIYVDTGAKVTRSQVLGTSGNTGSWNCQPLGYHLHFEARLSRSQSTHVNPVEYINVDWSKVLTLNAKSVPGRLSGDNPHPNF